MMSDKSKKWIEAGKLLAVDVNAHIICPECGLEDLTVVDNVNEKNPQQIERQIVCTNCGSTNYLRIKKEMILTNDIDL